MEGQCTATAIARKRPRSEVAEGNRSSRATDARYRRISSALDDNRPERAIATSEGATEREVYAVRSLDREEMRGNEHDIADLLSQHFERVQAAQRETYRNLVQELMAGIAQRQQDRRESKLEEFLDRTVAA